MRLLALALVVLLAGCSVRTHRVTVPAAALADLATTEIAIRDYGKVELNPYWWAQTTERRAVVTVLWTIAAVIVLEILHDRGAHGWAHGLEALFVGLKLAPAVYNVREMRE